MTVMVEVAGSWLMERRKRRRETDCTGAKGRDSELLLKLPL